MPSPSPDQPASNSISEFERALFERSRAGLTEPHLVAKWLQRDTWMRDEGLQLLLGVIPGPFDRGGPFRLVDDGGKTEQIISARLLDFALADLPGYLEASAFAALLDPPADHAFTLPSDFMLALGTRLRQLEDVWDSGSHPDRCAPAYFVDWAVRKGFEVSWLRWAVARGLGVPLPDEASKALPSEAVAVRPSESPQGLTTNQVAQAFADIKWSAAAWKKPLANKRMWLKDCVVQRGARGGPEAVWNPVKIAAALVARYQIPAKTLRARFNQQSLLKPWSDSWKDFEADFLASDSAQ